jgi:hypothetical protein
MKQFLNHIKRNLDHDLSLGYAKQLRWLFFLFVVVFLLILATLFAIAIIYKDFNTGDVNIPGTAFLLLTDPGNLSKFLPVNHSWIIGIIYAIITVAGASVFGGVLISLISNSVQRRVEKIENGNIHYNLHNHIVVIGYDTIVPALVSQIMNKWPDRDILLLTKKNPVEVRDTLNTFVNVNNKHLIIYSGQRSSETDLKKLQTENAYEIFIIGNRQSDDHDALNIDCLSKLVNLNKNKTPKRPTINILLENPATQTILQSTNLAANWKNVANVIPFSFYDNWARNVLTGKEFPRILVNPDSDQQLNVVIFGMSKMGVTMAVEAAHALHFPRKTDGSVRKTIITFVSLDAYKEMTLFRTRFHQIFEIQSSRYIDFIGEKDNTTITNPTFTELPPTYFSGKNADFLDIEFEFVRANALSKEIHQFLCDRIEKNHYRLSLFACTGKDTTDMNIALYMPELILRESDIYIRQHHSGQLLNWLRERSNEENGLYARIYPFGMENTIFDLLHQSQSMGKLINYYYWRHNNQPDIFKESHILNEAEKEDAENVWYNQTSIANQWSSSYCCMSFIQKMAQFGINQLNSTTIGEAKSVINNNIETLGYIEHNRWNMEKLLLGFRKPNANEQAEIDDSRKLYSDHAKQSKHDFFRRIHIHSYLCSFDDLADITWKGMDKDKDDIRKIDYDMLRQVPWIINNSEHYEE